MNYKENLKNISNPLQATNSLTSSFHSDKATQALIRVGEAVNLAVERFVKVGDAIAYENPSIKVDMLVACREAKESGRVCKLE